MTWLRDIAKASVWATVAFLIAIAFLRAGLFGSVTPLVLTLVVAPVAAYRWHHSRRFGALVAGWEVVLLVAAGLALAWVFRDFKFRAIQG